MLCQTVLSNGGTHRQGNSNTDGNGNTNCSSSSSTNGNGRGNGNGNLYDGLPNNYPSTGINYIDRPLPCHCTNVWQVLSNYPPNSSGNNNGSSNINSSGNVNSSGNINSSSNSEADVAVIVMGTSTKVRSILLYYC
jgi:hypothetical protein